jgi:formylglycine-generating enzyme required for sulfatase activity
MAYEVENESSDNEGPQRQVSVGKFQLSKTEVTLGQFKQFIAESGRTDLLDAVFMEGNRYGNNAPVLRVSWRMAQDFIAWLNAKEGGGYRLPSEAEWEYACRAGGKFKYCGSNKLSDVAWFVDNSGDKPHPVATKKPNAFGLYDMSGNAREWVQDCHRLGYRNAPATGGVWPGGDCDSRMKRGGSWDHEAPGNRAADRDNGNPGYGDRLTGFRVARSI